ncbi:MAG: hypothetical protein AAGA99_17375 [Actinomycetota bacterium]
MEIVPMVSVHVPKAGGTSFQLTLHQFFGNRLWLDHGVPADPPPHAACIHGHASARHRLEQFPEAVLVGWVRDPVERILSQWRYWRRRPDHGHPVCQRLHDEDLGPVELAELLPDVQAQMLGDDLARYDFIGVVERAELSMTGLRALLGASGLFLPHINLTAAKDVTEAERRAIAERCEADVETYRHGVERLKAVLTTEPDRTRLWQWAHALPGTPVRGYGRAA